jgi:dephospho-CoA kinase
MFVVALTGGIGCGKSEATKIFAELGISIVDLDVISHRLTNEDQSTLNEIAKQFGAQYLQSDGVLDRDAMRKLVFSDPKARERLNGILHPAIHQEAIKALTSEKNTPYVILAIPLLDKHSPYMEAIDRVLLIDCSEKTQIARVKSRSKLHEDEIQRIIQAQSSREARLEIADDVIENNNNLSELREKILAIHQKYIRTCIVSKTTS